jgi:hypothetical protein
MFPFCVPFIILSLFVEILRACFWCCLYSWKEKEKICKFKNLKGHRNKVSENDYPSKPPYPNKKESIKHIKKYPLSFGEALSNIEEELTCRDACAVCLFGVH